MTEATGRAMTPQALFVVGNPRSGTTVVKRILNTHPRIHIANETQFVLYSQRRLDRVSLALSEEEVKAFFREIVPFLVAEKWGRIPTFDDFGRSSASYPELYRFVCMFENDGKTDLAYWGDNTPRYVMIMDLLMRCYEGARFINIVRDPRDVFSSVKKLHIGAHTALISSMEWVDRVARGMCGAHIGGNDAVLLIRYEDLVLRTDDTLQSLANFLGVAQAFDPNGVDAQSIRAAEMFAHHTKLALPLEASSVGSYRRTLSAEEISVIEAITYPFLVALDYEVDSYRPTPPLLSDYGRLAREYADNYLLRRRRSLQRKTRARVQALGGSRLLGVFGKS